MTLSQYAQTPIIDRDQFDMLIATGEDEAVAMLNELLELYTGEAEPKLKELHSAAALGDRQRCNRIAHALAGASANLGGLRLASLCRAYENSVQSQSVEQLKTGAVHIEETYHITVVEMRAEVAKIS